MTGLEKILFLVGTVKMRTVADVRAGAYVPPARIRIVGIRNGDPVQTETVDAKTVDWTRLMPEDFIEEVPGG